MAQGDPSPLVRKAAAGALTARAGPRAVESLGALACDPDPGVATAAIRGLSALPQEARARPLLVEAWWQAPPEVRGELAAALDAVGASPREAVALEARRAWERNARALEAGAPGARAGAAEELGRSGRSEAVRLLLPLLEAGPPELAAGAARGLGHSGDRAARAPLEDLLESRDAEVAEAAAQAIAELGDPAASASLAALASGGPGRLAAIALDALSALPPAPEVGVSLCEVALRSTAPRVAGRAAREARLRDADCPERPLIARLGRRGSDLAAGLAAAAELSLPPDRRQPLADRIAPLVSSPGLDPATRAAAAAALGRLGTAAAGPALLKRAADLRSRLATARARTPGDNPDPGPEPGEVEELAAAAPALARLGGGGWEDLARSLLADPSPTLRAAAVEALSVGGGAALDAAVPLLDDPARPVRLAAARALGRRASPGGEALARAAKAAAGDDVEWHQVLARALGDSGSPAAAAALGRLLLGPAAPEAALALGRLGAREAAPLLEAHLVRRGNAGRAEALEALASLAGPAACPAAARELWSERADVRAAAARVAGRLRCEACAAWLEALRADYARDVRWAAIEALARLPVGRRDRR